MNIPAVHPFEMRTMLCCMSHLGAQLLITMFPAVILSLHLQNCSCRPGSCDWEWVTGALLAGGAATILR